MATTVTEKRREAFRNALEAEPLRKPGFANEQKVDRLNVILEVCPLFSFDFHSEADSAPIVVHEGVWVVQEI